MFSIEDIGIKVFSGTRVILSTRIDIVGRNSNNLGVVDRDRDTESTRNTR